MTEQFREKSFSPEKSDKQIIMGYSSIFDQIPSDPKEFEEFKNKYKPAIGKIIDAWTIPDLYSATKEIINLPDTVDENEMRRNLTYLCSAEIPMMQKDPPLPAALWAYTIIDKNILMRLASIS
ncbi:MAG: hypothetical protein PHE59_02725 [Patescibacteria group bacterium]|nr:hypothetical protein [Patescibacteria group bacterium]MDD5164380.1 hypothetical protein [Patescibacteria group bacterium]MDD5534968.1 hypothetical protein [Patescibacteria group bacterium]